MREISTPISFKQAEKILKRIRSEEESPESELKEILQSVELEKQFSDNNPFKTLKKVS